MEMNHIFWRYPSTYCSPAIWLRVYYALLGTHKAAAHKASLFIQRAWLFVRSGVNKLINLVSPESAPWGWYRMCEYSVLTPFFFAHNVRAGFSVPWGQNGRDTLPHHFSHFINTSPWHKSMYRHKAGRDGTRRDLAKTPNQRFLHAQGDHFKCWLFILLETENGGGGWWASGGA